MESLRSRLAGAIGWSNERTAATAFWIYLTVSLPILIYVGSHYWFIGDEWGFLVGGDISDPAVLFRAIHSHWSTLPILVYRALYGAFGLHSYLPFQLCIILLHLTLCYLLRVIMLRAGVGPWLATITAATFVLFGPGYVNILAGVQISQVGSIVLGVALLILADHDGRIDYRDWLGLLCGLGCIMSSGLGPPLVGIVGLATILRRGLRPALFHTVPLATIYVVWLVWNDIPSPAGQGLPPLGIIAQWIIHGQSGVFLALGGGVTIVAVALGALLIIGLALAWMPLSRPALRQRACVPTAMLIGAIGLFAVICTQRWLAGVDGARMARYISVCTALTLPALAVAADAVVRRRQWMMPVVCVLFLVGLVINTNRFSNDLLRSPATFTALRTTLLAAAYSPLAEHAPADLIPEPNLFTGGIVDMGFLLAARNSGRLPPPPPMTDTLRSQTELRLSLQRRPAAITDPTSCEVYTGPITLTPKAGDLYKFTTPVWISLGKKNRPLGYNSGWGALPVVKVLRPDLQLYVTHKRSATSFGMCH